MPTVNDVIGGMLQNAISHPKSTIQSILTALMFGTTALLACGCVSGKVVAIAGGVLTVAKVGLGMMQTDGLTVPPGSKINQVAQSASDGQKSESSITTSITTPKA
jgi:hypothetical protein